MRLPDGASFPRGFARDTRFAWPLERIDRHVTLAYGRALVAGDRRPGPVSVFGSNGQCGVHDQALATGPGVILGRKGQGPLGVVWSDGDFWVIDTAYYAQLQSDALDLRYFYYCAKYIGLNHLKDGTSNPTLSRDRFGRQAFPMPSLPTQRRIAGILSAYDDLIENNTKRIKILEEMARALYREWFVHFRFPGHEKVKLIDSLLGKIPEGWEAVEVHGAFDYLGGGTPSKTEPDYWEGGTHVWYSPTDLTASKSMFIDQSTAHITDLGLAKSSAKEFPAMSVMMTSRATLGVLAINTAPASTNQGFITCIPNERFPLYWLYHWLEQSAPVLETIATGATFKEITKRAFAKHTFVAPPPRLTAGYQERVDSICSLVRCLGRQNRVLRDTRDLLLPRLISGELDVDNLDLPEAAE